MLPFNIIQSFFSKWEKIIFYLILILSLLPIIWVKHLHTYDGPAHLYNSNLLYYFLFNDSSFIGHYFFINKTLSPNWISHLLLSFLHLPFPLWLAEKLMLSLYVLLLPIAFRGLIKTINPASLTYFLIFPFIYSFVFFMGFYNFCLSLPVFFFTLNYWLKNENLLSFKKVIIMTFLFLLLFFFHGLSFVFLALTIGIILLNTIFKNYFSKQALKNDFLNIGVYIIALLPSLFLLALFILKNPSGKMDYLPKKELLDGLLFFRPLIVFNVQEEQPYTKIIAIIFAILMLPIIALMCKCYFADNRKTLFSKWFLIANAFFILYWLLPDSMASGGMVSVRVCLFFFMALILWFAAKKLPLWIEIIAVFCVLASTAFLGIYHAKISQSIDEDVREIYSVESYLQPNKTLLPLNYSGNWLQPHFSNYLGMEKTIVIFENYEAANNYFPLKWKPEVHPYLFGNAFGNPPCADIEKYENETGGNVDYILRWRFNQNLNDSCTLKMLAQLDRNYMLIFVSEKKNAELFLKR